MVRAGLMLNLAFVVLLTVFARMFL